MDERFLYAILATTLAGLATGIGSVIAFAVKKPGKRFMGFTLGFSAGVMVYVSFVELLPDSIAKLGGFEGNGFLFANLAFFIGMIVFFVIDLAVPHEFMGHVENAGKDSENQKCGPLRRVGVLVALGIAIHNFPEGAATFMGMIEDYRLGIAIAVAIALHNIPEGIAVSVPIYAATCSKSKAFIWSFASGLTEPLGALAAALILWPFMSAAVLGWVLGAVAGIMVAISLDELVPAAKEFGSEHTPIIGVIVGMAVMVTSLILFHMG
jgi:ZIP family zinc transporter